MGVGGACKDMIPGWTGWVGVRQQSYIIFGWERGQGRVGQ
jgi:hypothetical protein